MNWGEASEILGALVVVPTLTYLSRQLSQYGIATTSGTMDSWLSDYNVLVLELFKEREAASVVRRGLPDFEGLDGDDKMRFHAWMIMHIFNAQNMYMQREDDIMHKELSEVVLAFNASMLKLKSGYKWWEGARMPLNADFVEFMEGQIKDVNR